MLLGLVLGAGAGQAVAQQASMRVVEVREGGATLEVRAQWPQPLGESLAVAKVPRLGEAAVRAAVGTWTEVSKALTLPILAVPSVRVVAADFDEVPLAAGDATWTSHLEGEVVEAVGLGVERKRPAATVVARLVAYDASRQVLRRYRRLVIEVRYAQAAARGRAALTAQTNPHLAVDRSVLADGAVFKFPVTEEGIYRIDRDFIGQLGLSPGSVDPAQVKVYGNGGAPLPALNSAPRPADLVENPVFVRGGGDGSFDDGDVILFHARAPRGWRYDAGAWMHYVNPFSNENYYFIKVDDAESERVGEAAYPGLSGARVMDRVVGRFVEDFDEEIWSKESGSGLTWVSKILFSGNERAVFSGVTPPGFEGGAVTYQARVAVQSINLFPEAAVTFSSGGEVLHTLRPPRGVLPQSDQPIAEPAEATFTHAAPGPALDLSLRLEERANDPEAALDWVRAFYEQRLIAEGGLLRFATPGGESGPFEFVLRGFGGEPQVWDVTEPGHVRRLGVRREGNAYRVQVSPEAGVPRELIAFTDDAVRAVPEAGAPVEAQNLHGTETYPDFVIVAPAEFAEPAADLADYRRQEGLAVEVVLVEHIYNEFSGGVPDMRAVRDYFKFLYDRDAGAEPRFRYALLMGDGHVNFRGLGDTEPELENWIFPYETDETFDPIRSYTSDDYFGLLDDHEGIWAYNSTSERLDLGIGRFVAQSSAQAQLIVDKIKQYEDPANYGAWRSRYVFVADDGPSGSTGSRNDDDLHTKNAEDVAEGIVKPLAPSVNVKKIYAMSFDRVFRGAWRIPEAKDEILRIIDEGALVVNYTGHGGVNGLAQEEIFLKEDAEALTNGHRMPIFITATCSFGRWDEESSQSGAEVLLLNENGGAVALMTTVRVVYTSSSPTSLNTGLNRELNVELFRRGADGLPPRLGDALRRTKQGGAGLQNNNRKFNLLGDPTMRFGLPSHYAVVQSVNGTPLAGDTLQLRALDRITLAGDVLDPDSTLAAGFNGAATLTVFDAERNVTLKYRRYITDRDYYVVREDLIWRGEVAVRDGRFQATFVVPKDISYSNRTGRISVYAASAEAQGLGFTENVVVGGSVPNPPDDARGPELEVFLGDTTFVSGGLTTTQPELIVKLFDESGINTVGAGVGHEMLVEIDGDRQSAIEIGGAFQSEANSFQRGRVVVTLPEQAPGPHTLRVKAWDVVNNSSEIELDYVVASDERLEVRRVYNYPNPMHRETRFVFEHNQRPGTAAEVQVRVYTLTGQPVRTLEESEALPAGVLAAGPVQVPWDGRDDDGDALAPGIYLYKVRVEVERPDGEREVAERIEKLALVR